MAEDETGMISSDQEDAMMGYPVDAEFKDTAVAVREAPTALTTPFQMDPAEFRRSLELVSENRATLMEWVRSHMVDGVDFGKIHVVKRDKCDKGKYCKNPGHFSKPSLWKPGAEKIAGLLSLIVVQPNLESYEQAAIEGREIKQIILKTEVKNMSGQVIATGIGARSLAQDYGDLNKALKMAAKSSYIDGVLKAGGLSEVFTLDIEDMVRDGRMDGDGERSVQSGEPAAPESVSETKMITEPQVTLVCRLAKSHVWSDKEKADLVEDKVKLWTFERAKKGIDWMQTEIKMRKDAEKTEAEAGPAPAKAATLSRLRLSARAKRILANGEAADTLQVWALLEIEATSPLEDMTEAQAQAALESLA